MNQVPFTKYKEDLIKDIRYTSNVRSLKNRIDSIKTEYSEKEYNHIVKDLKSYQSMEQCEREITEKQNNLKKFKQKQSEYNRRVIELESNIKRFNLFAIKERQINIDLRREFDFNINFINEEMEKLHNIDNYIWLINIFNSYESEDKLVPNIKQYNFIKERWSNYIKEINYHNFSNSLVTEWKQDEVLIEEFEMEAKNIKDKEKHYTKQIRDLEQNCNVNEKLFSFFESDLSELNSTKKQIRKDYISEKYDVTHIHNGFDSLQAKLDEVSSKYDNLVKPLRSLLSEYDFKKENIVEDVSEYYLYSLAKNIEKSRQLYGSSKNITEDEINAWIKGIESNLYTLTNDQEKAIRSAAKYLNENYTSSCLIQGDVSCGKTIVIVVMMFILAKKNIKSVFIAPRKILRRQHLKSLQKYNELFNMNLKIVDADEEMDFRDADIIVSGYSFNDFRYDQIEIGLGVIDEIQLFGVKQRSQVQQKYPNIDMLYTTATPHPRTKLISLIGNMDIIEIREMPKGRVERITESYKKITTKHDNLIHQEIKKGHMIISVSPLVNKEGHGDYESVRIAYATYCKKYPEYKVELLLASMSQDKKDEILLAAQNGEIDILVATKTIEVGVDIPNATVIFIHYPHSMPVKWGMAQLHQLRGRVGRNNKQSYCLIESPEEVEEGSPIGSIIATNDVFKLTQDDFDWRGFEKIIGTSQSGGTCSKKEQEEKINAYKTIAKKTPELISNLKPKQIDDVEDMLKSFYISNIN